MRSGSVVFCILAAWSGMPSGVAADPPIQTAEASADQACRSYTQTAVRQQHFNHWRKCGFQGARWNFDSNAHLKWCLSATAAQRAQENRARTADLSKCPKSWCERYADRAVLQAGENEKLGCGFGGPRWAKGWDTHYDWCFYAKSETSGREWQERNVAMNKCKAEKGRR